VAADRDGVISTLNHLIEACIDREHAYRDAAAAACNADLKDLLQKYERQSAEYAAELQAEVRGLGGEPEAKGTVGGLLTRGWQSLKGILADCDDASLIAECQRGECAARAEYEAALKGSFPRQVRGVLRRQYAGVKEGCERLHALELVAAGSA
jgi:uncharacterized protein (TIGR02284 family)